MLNTTSGINGSSSDHPGGALQGWLPKANPSKKQTIGIIQEYISIPTIVLRFTGSSPVRLYF
jgi:hypothetical protein